jgi:hypothetical protein
MKRCYIRLLCADRDGCNEAGNFTSAAIWSLKASTYCASIADCGSLFHAVVTRFVKKCRLSSHPLTSWGFRRQLFPVRLYELWICYDGGVCGTKKFIGFKSIYIIHWASAYFYCQLKYV